MRTYAKHSYMLAIVLMLAIGAAILSCGNGDITGPGGSWGEDNTNTRVLLELIPASIEMDICNAVSVGLLANITTEQINLAMSPNTLYLEGYEVTFAPDVPGSPEMAGDKYNLSSALPASDLDLFFIGPDIKADFLNDINSGQYVGLQEFPSYTARYTAYGTDNYNGTPRVWGSRASFSFKMGRYSTCLPSMLPNTDSVIAIPYPDYSTDDNRIFRVIGGTSPYTVTSSDNSLVKAVSNGNVFTDFPLYLPMGQVHFEVDFSPDLFGIKVITLTLRDAAGEQAVSTITVDSY